MANFYSVFEFLAVSAFDSTEADSFDLLLWLPSEMAVKILKLLPDKDILNAACVSRIWLTFCKSDKKIRQRIRRYLRHLRKERLANILVDRSGTNSAGLPWDRPTMSIFNHILRDDKRVTRFTGYSGDRTAVRYSPYNHDLFIRSRKPKPLKSQGGKATSGRKSFVLRM